MKLDDAIKAGYSKSRQGRGRRKNNFYNSPAFPDKLVRLFNSKFRDYNYGSPQPISKQVRGMLNGLIKVCRTSHWCEREIYEAIEYLVVHWDFIKTCEHHTIKNHKKVVLGDRPSLLEFLICRESILTAIDKAKTMKIEIRNKEVSTIQVSKTKKSFVPSEEEMQAEYEKQMEDLIGE